MHIFLFFSLDCIILITCDEHNRYEASHYALVLRFQLLAALRYKYHLPQYGCKLGRGVQIPPLYQYNETNVVHVSFNLLRIKGLCIFRALLAHPQEVLHKRHLVYCMRIMSVGWVMIIVKQKLHTVS
jgi:hypothetical protein